jgi:hypothetical protein
MFTHYKISRNHWHLDAYYRCDQCKGLLKYVSNKYWVLFSFRYNVLEANCTPKYRLSPPMTYFTSMNVTDWRNIYFLRKHNEMEITSCRNITCYITLQHLLIKVQELKMLKSLYRSSQSHVTTDRQSGKMSGCWAHSGTCDQILLSVWRLIGWKLLPCLCGVPSLMRRRVCHLSFSVYGNLSAFTSSIYVSCFLRFKIVYTIYTKLLSVPARYSRLCHHSSKYNWMVV